MADSGDDSGVDMGAISSGGGLIGGIIDSIVGPIMGVVNAKKAWKRQKKILKNRIRWAMQDMKRAGINPVLAAGGGFAGSGSAQQAISSGTDFGGSFDRFSARNIALSQNKADLAVKEQAVKTAEAQQKAAESAADKSAADADLQRHQDASGGYWDQQTQKAANEAAAASAQESYFRAQEEGLRKKFPEMDVEAELYRSGIGAKLKFMEKAGHSAGEISKALSPFK